MDKKVGDTKLPLINQSQIKLYIKTRGFKSTESFIVQLQEGVKLLIDQAIDIAQANGRKTISNKDLIFTRRRALYK